MKAVSYTNKRLQAAPARIPVAPRMHVDMTQDAARMQMTLLKPRSTEKVRDYLLAIVIGILLAAGWMA